MNPLFLYLYDFPNITSGADAFVLQLTEGSFYWLVPLILLFVFLLIFIGGITRQKLRTGTSDYSAWAVIASIAMWLVALMFSVTSGFIRADWLVITVSITIITGIWFFWDRKVTEV